MYSSRSAVETEIMVTGSHFASSGQFFFAMATHKRNRPQLFYKIAQT